MLRCSFSPVRFFFRRRQYKTQAVVHSAPLYNTVVVSRFSRKPHEACCEYERWVPKRVRQKDMCLYNRRKKWYHRCLCDGVSLCSFYYDQQGLLGNKFDTLEFGNKARHEGVRRYAWSAIFIFTRLLLNLRGVTLVAHDSGLCRQKKQ